MLVGGVPIDLDPAARVSVIALGKAAPAMARAALAAISSLPGSRLRDVRAVVAHPRGIDSGAGWPAGTRCFAAGHPLPDATSLAAADAAAELCGARTPEDLVLALVSGGGSALFESPWDRSDLEGVRELTQSLLLAGADIRELNTVRRALSRVKGGGLARLARPARVVTLIVSDVAGDSPAEVASGPTVPSPTSVDDARAVLERFGLAERFARLVAKPTAPDRDAGYEAIDRDRVIVVASNRTALEAARAEAAARGFDARIDESPLAGEARDAGTRVGGVARALRERRASDAPPAGALWGGETTVTVRGDGCGGRNQELALAAAVAIDGCPRTAVMTFATDGVDGPTDAAGAVVTGESLARARELGRSAAEALARNDSNSFLRATGELVITGPTGTNVNDLAVALVYP